MSDYEVYIEQINQSKFIVTADDQNEAIDKAVKLWRKENMRPDVTFVEVIE